MVYDQYCNNGEIGEVDTSNKMSNQMMSGNRYFHLDLRDPIIYNCREARLKEL